MQKLVWQNSDGDELDLTSGNYGITEWEGFSNAGLNIQSQQVPFQDGAVFLDALIEPRELSVTLAMQDNNNLELRYQLRRELIHKLNPKLGEGYLIYTNDFTSKRIKCVSQIPLFENHNSNDSGTPKASLTWTACEPYWEDLEETVVSLMNGERKIIVNEGETTTGVKVDIYTLDKVKNPTVRINDKHITLNGQLETGIQINTNNGTKTVQSSILKYNNETSTGRISAVAYAEDKDIICMVGSSISIKEGEKDWELVDSGIGNTILEAVIYSKRLGMFIAVGEDKIITSENARVWTQRTNPTDNALNAICEPQIEDNNVLFIVGRRGTILVSNNGQNYSNVTTSINEELTDITYSETLNRFVATCDNGSVAVHNYNDAHNVWTTYQTPATSLFAITYSEEKEKFIAVGNGIYQSSNGIAYTSITVETEANYFTNVIYAKELSKFIVLTNKNSILFSNDITNWVEKSILQEQSVPTFYSLFYYKQGGYTLAMGNMLAQSNNLEQWEILQEEGSSYNFTKIIEADGFYCALNGGGEIFVNKNGKWESKYQDIRIKAICYSKELHLILGMGNNNALVTSSNGEEWTTQTTEYTGSYLDVIYDGNYFIAVGNGTNAGIISRSQNGLNWEVVESGISNSLNAIIYAEGKYISVGNNGTIVTSEDVESWTERTSGTNQNLNGIAYSPRLSVYVAVGSSGTVLKSSNGVNWVQVESGTTRNLESICYSAIMNYLCLVGANGFIMISSDAVHFIEQETPIAGDLYCVIAMTEKEGFLISSSVIYSTILSTMGNIINLLSNTSDMGLCLKAGENNALYYDEYGNNVCLLTYRQKYIGV